MSRAGGSDGCPPGDHWDILLMHCVGPSQSTVDQPQPKGSRPVTQQRTGMVLSPVVCAVVVLATLGSILVLSVWCFLYRRHGSRSRASQVALAEVGGGHGDEEEGQEELLQKAELPAALPTCLHLRPDPVTSLQWQEGGQQREPEKHTCRESGGGLPEHRIPLPATELGDTALVTTKTVKEGE